MHCPLMAESLATGLGEQQPGDLKESLDYGPGRDNQNPPRYEPVTCGEPAELKYRHAHWLA